MRRGIALLLAGVLVLAVAGTALADGIETSDTCVKFEDEAIGVDGISATLDGVTVTLTGWITKTDEPDEFIGFSYEVTDGWTFDMVKVKFGRDVAYVDGDSWLNANDNVRAISHVEFCSPTVDPGGGGDDPGGVIGVDDDFWFEG